MNSIPISGLVSWDQLSQIYVKLGKSSPIRWWLCNGSDGNPHPPTLLSPSSEDHYEGPNVIKCGCDGGSRLQQNCTLCCEKCPLCGRFWKYVLVVDYLPIGTQLASLCNSSSHCFESLELWHQWGRWLGKTPSFQSKNIFEFWDGIKMRAYEAFWDPNAQWELPVICTNNNCKSIYRAFPNPCMEILQGWDVSTQQYKFCCSKCSTLIVCAKQTKQVCVHDLIQMVFSTHWFFFWPTSLFFLPTGFFLPTSLFLYSLVCFSAHWFFF